MNFLHEYAGKVSLLVEKLCLKDVWIVDTGASTHICINRGCFKNLRTLEVPISVNMPNGDIVKVRQVGTAFYNCLELHDTLYIPAFTHNLHSVNRLCSTNSITCSFFATFCLYRTRRVRKFWLLEG